MKEQSQEMVQQVEGMPAAAEGLEEQGEISVDAAQSYRAGAYGLLAALLRSSPNQKIIDHISSLANEGQETDELSMAMSVLGLAASRCDIDAIDDEYHALFIGIGRGELVPFGSWYLTGFLMEKPLGVLRDDLSELGFERSENVSEPEDHIAALCEVMALMIEGHVSEEKDGDFTATQKNFFDAHIDSWADRFFSDLTTSDSAVFYRSVGRFGWLL